MFSFRKITQKTITKHESLRSLFWRKSLKSQSWQYKHQSPRRKVQLNFHFHSSKLEIKHTLKGRSPLSLPQKLHGSHKQKNQLNDEKFTANKKKIQLHMEATMLLTNYCGQISFINTSFFRMDKGNRNSKHLCNGLQTKPLLNGCVWKTNTMVHTSSLGVVVLSLCVNNYFIEYSKSYSSLSNSSKLTESWHSPKFIYTKS
jgi:hypothetical protein